MKLFAANWTKSAQTTRTTGVDRQSANWYSSRDVYNRQFIRRRRRGIASRSNDGNVHKRYSDVLYTLYWCFVETTYTRGTAHTRWRVLLDYVCCECSVGGVLFGVCRPI